MDATQELIGTCRECGEEVHSDTDYRRIDASGNVVCETCAARGAYVGACWECSDSIRENDDYSTDSCGHVLCNSCSDDGDVYVCDECGEFVRAVNVYSSPHDEGVFCHYCYSHNFDTCDACGNLIRTDDAVYTDDDETLCTSCNDAREEARAARIIAGYHDTDKARTFFTLPNERETCRAFYGIEIEAEGTYSADLDSVALAARECMESGTLFFEHDGSLDCGYETITAPMSRAYIRANFHRFRDMLATMRAHGLKSHDTSTCGLHVHVSRAAFGELESERELNITRTLLIVETFWTDVLAFSRRTENAAAHWAASYGVKDAAQLESIVKSPRYNAARYRAVNLANEATVEFRIFRGTLNAETLDATLEFVHALIVAASALSVDRIRRAKSLREVLNAGSRGHLAPALISYLDSKGL